jgi:hypothetical protein
LPELSLKKLLDNLSNFLYKRLRFGVQSAVSAFHKVADIGKSVGVLIEQFNPDLLHFRQTHQPKTTQGITRRIQK